MATDIHSIESVFNKQRAFFNTGVTRPYAFRKAQLKLLYRAVKERSDSILEALREDMNKPEFEAYGSEVGLVLLEISHALKHLKEWMRPQKGLASVAHFPSTTKVITVPKGQVLILSPWNYPFQLVINPLIASIAAGNTAILKLPWQTPATSAVVDDLINSTFSEDYICTVKIKDEEIIPRLVKGLRFDHIFFTGSTRVGKMILTAAAENLIPITLELGGKSPVIVDSSANLDVAAKRIIWAKAFNAGQTCIAPDYVLAHHEIKEALLHRLRMQLDDMMDSYGGLNGMAQIINAKRFETLMGLLEDEKDIYGGDVNADELKLGLSIVDEPSLESPLMKEEIFGPILPVIAYQNDEEMRSIIARNPNPLSLYIFTKDRKWERQVMETIPFGGGCVNNCMVHFAIQDIPFGGIGESGIGNYHGKHGFENLSLIKSIVKTGTWIDVPIRYVPYSPWKMWVLKKLLR